MFHMMYHISCGSDVDTKVKLRALLTDSHIYIYIFNLSLSTFSLPLISFLIHPSNHSLDTYRRETKIH